MTEYEEDSKRLTQHYTKRRPGEKMRIENFRIIQNYFVLYSIYKASIADRNKPDEVLTRYQQVVDAIDASLNEQMPRGTAQPVKDAMRRFIAYRNHKIYDYYSGDRIAKLRSAVIFAVERRLLLE